MKKNFRSVLALILCIAMLLAVAGCASKAPTEASTKAPVADSSSESLAKTGEKVTITYQSWNPYPEQLASTKEDFEKKFSNIALNYVMVPYSDHIQKLKIDLASGQGPDVFALQTGAPLKEFGDFEVDLAPLAVEKWGADWEKNFIPFTLQLIKNGNSYVALPLGTGYAGMIWADLSFFTKYNLQVPKNLTELKTVTKTLREKGEKYPLAIGAKDDWINLDMWMNIANDISSEKLYSAIDGKTPFTDAGLVESFKIWQSLFTEKVFQDGALGVNMYVDTTDLFEREGIVPMVTNGAWLINSYPNPDPAMSKIFNGGEHPHTTFTMDWNNDGKPAPVQSNVEVAMSMNKDSKLQKEAWDFISYMMYDGQDILINKFLMYFPSRTDLVYSGELSEEGKKNFNILMDWGANNVGGYRENPYPELKQAIANNLKALALGEATPEKAAEAVEAVSKTTKR